MKKYLLIPLFLFASLVTAAQDYKVSKTGGKIVLNLPSVTVEGYNGNEVIFSSERDKEDEDPRAKGLRAINGAGYNDNTGLGINVTKSGSTLEVNQVAGNPSVKILVPKGIVVSFECHRIMNAGKVIFKSIPNELEISTDYNHIELENVTGPVSVRALYGAVDAKFTEPIKGPVSIASIYSTVDVAIPVTTKVNVRLSCSHGTILASSDLKIIMEKNTNDNMISYGNVVNGKLNGGGPEFKLSAEFGKIYLRKSK